MARILLTNAPDHPAYELSGDVFSIGRLPDNNLPLADALVSRRHAEIRKEGDKYRVVDLESLNGVYVNNLKIKDEYLTHGDVLHIGESKMLFEDSPSIEAPPPITESVNPPPLPGLAPGPAAKKEGPVDSSLEPAAGWLGYEPDAPAPAPPSRGQAEAAGPGPINQMKMPAPDVAPPPEPGPSVSGPSFPPSNAARAPGLAGPEIIKPLNQDNPNFELEAISLEEALKPIRDESQVPYRNEPVRARNFFILYQVARALNSTNSLNELLDQTMTLVFQVINAERGVIFLYNEKGEITPMIARNREGGELPELNVSKGITLRAIQEKVSIITSDARYDPRFQAGASIVTYNIRSAICVPLWEHGRIRGAVYLDNLMETYAFGEDDLDLLTAIANQVAIAIRQEEMQSKMRENAVFRANLERFHSPDLVNHIMQQSRLDDGFRQSLEVKEVTVLFSDIVSFTPMLERLDAHEAADLLKSYFDKMTEIIFRYKGTVDKFIGDAIMAIFGAPVAHGNDAEQAVLSAIEMMRELERFKTSWSEEKRFDVRIGINTGKVVTGYLGSKHRVEYTVLGDPVNVASRLQSFADPGTILVGQATYEKARESFKFRDRGATRLKGKQEETRLYEVVF